MTTARNAPGKSRRRSSPDRPTLQQVARLAGSSVSTVSAVLNDQPYCWASEVTKRRIREAAATLNYRPNIAARMLRGGATQTVGLITVALNVEVTATKVQAFEEAARDAGYVTMITFNPNVETIEDKLILKLLDRRVDGLALYPTETGDHAQLRRLVRDGYPVVTIDGAGRLPFECDDVSTDYFAAGRLQGEHLLSLGRRRICNIATFPTCYVKDQMRAGLRQALADAGAPAPVMLNVECDPHVGSVIRPDLVEQLRVHLGRFRGEIDAIASYDMPAVAAVNAALSLGIKVPDELAVIGFDDSPLAAGCAIPLTSIGQQAAEIGRRVFELLQHRMADRTQRAPARRVMVEPALVQRASTAGRTHA